MNESENCGPHRCDEGGLCVSVKRCETRPNEAINTTLPSFPPFLPLHSTRLGRLSLTSWSFHGGSVTLTEHRRLLVSLIESISLVSRRVWSGSWCWVFGGSYWRGGQSKGGGRWSSMVLCASMRSLLFEWIRPGLFCCSNLISSSLLCYQRFFRFLIFTLFFWAFSFQAICGILGFDLRLLLGVWIILCAICFL